MLKNENGMSELIGALMILLTTVVFLGVLQSYEVPKWNKELESQHFETVYSDFVNLKSDIEDVSVKNIPKSSDLHMGIRYPQRFMLQNPSPGAQGYISTYPLNINVSYINPSGQLTWKNYTSIGIVYQLYGLLDFPKLVFENGIIIKDFGNSNFTENEDQTLTTEDTIFIPIIEGSIGPISSMEVETLDIRPFPQKNYSQPRFSSMSVAVETRYPDIWAKLSIKKPPGSNFTVDKTSNTIKITNVPGFNITRLKLPDSGMNQQAPIYTGMVSLEASVSNRGKTGPDGQDVWAETQGRLDIPDSASISQFIIRDIRLAQEDEEKGEDSKLEFSVIDINGKIWKIRIKFKLGNSPEISEVKQKKPTEKKYNDFDGTVDSSTQIDLTSIYRNADIGIPNVLNIDRKDDGILSVNFLIN